MELTPSYLAELTNRLDTLSTDLASLRLLVTGGEILPPAITRAWFEHLPSVHIANTYGPTEAAISATACYLTAPATTRSVPIGRPLPGRRLYIVDSRDQLVPPGVPGELLIGGPALARGYLSHPALTAERFTPDPHTSDGTRLYHTGDLARWLPDGNLEYLGRTDNQIKIRGIRIEPGEIEAALGAFPGARGAAVLVREIHGEPSLIGYVAGSGLETSPLKAWCQRFLPDYMVPVVLTVLDALPLTVHGKVDTNALPGPELLAATEYVAPQSPTEVVIAQIWVELLGVSQVGLRDNFFALGGHSLRAVSAVSRLRAAFGCPIDVRHLFEHPTVEGLSAEVERLLIEQISAMSEEDIGLSLMADPPN
jgi:acyl-CoA synthetase (AMP-forming)/AMP-acid ligase II/acyl carrier protein